MTKLVLPKYRKPLMTIGRDVNMPCIYILRSASALLSEVMKDKIIEK
jgi:hypothetical protein